MLQESAAAAEALTRIFFLSRWSSRRRIPLFEILHFEQEDLVIYCLDRNDFACMRIRVFSWLIIVFLLYKFIIQGAERKHGSHELSQSSTSTYHHNLEPANFILTTIVQVHDLE